MSDSIDDFDEEDLSSLAAMRLNLERDISCICLEEESLHEKQDQLERHSTNLSIKIADSLDKIKSVNKNITKFEEMNSITQGHLDALPKQETHAKTILENLIKNESIRDAYLAKIAECMTKKRELLESQETELSKVLSDAQIELDAIKEQEGKNSVSMKNKLKLIESQKHWLERDLQQIQMEIEELTTICSDLIQTSP